MISSKDGKLNLILFFSVVAIFLIGLIYVEAVSISLFSPGNYSFNSSTRNINFTFNVTWQTGWENQSNCTLFVVKRNSTGAYASWQAVANATNGSSVDANITNSSTSYMNYTFSTDGNYTWNIGCMNSSSVDPGVNYFNTSNFSLVVDIQDPSFTNTLSNSTTDSLVASGESLVIGINATDTSGIIAGSVLYVNASGTLNTTYKVTSVGNLEYMLNYTYIVPSNAVGQLINFTIEVNDSVGRKNQTTMFFTVAQDGTAPGPINLSNPINMHNQSSTTVTFNFSAIDNNDTSLICALNISKPGSSTYASIENIEVTSGTAQDSNSTTLINGIYVWNATCRDSPGNTNTSLSRTFTVDTTKPYLSNSSVTNTSGDSELAPFEYVTFTTNVSDNLTKISAVRLLVNVSGGIDNEVNISREVPTNTTVALTFRVPINSTHGTVFNFTIQVNDSVGNINNTATLILNVSDSTPPSVTINNPIAAQDQSSFIINATLSTDAINCSYILNTSTSNSTETELSRTGTECTSSVLTGLLNWSTYNLTVRAYDVTGNRNETRLVFTIGDLTPHHPTVSIGTIDDDSAEVLVSSNESVNMSITSTGSNDFDDSSTSSYSKTPSITISGLSDDTTYNFSVTTCDKAGNCITNSSFGFETDEQTSSGSSGSGGGGGGAAGTTSNVAATTGRTWDKLDAGSDATLSINNNNIALTAVEIETKNALTSPGVTVESLKAKPTTVSTAASIKVYQYLDIKKANFQDSDLSSAKLRFKVQKSWLTSNVVDEKSIVLYRYSSNTWNKLSTVMTGGAADPTYWYYEASTPGFSTFAIGSDESYVPTSAEAPAPVLESTAVCGNAACEIGESTENCAQDCPTSPAPVETQSSEPTVEPQKDQKRTVIAWIIVGLVVVISALGYYSWQKKKQHHRY